MLGEMHQAGVLVDAALYSQIKMRQVLTDHARFLPPPALSKNRDTPILSSIYYSYNEILNFLLFWPRGCPSVLVHVRLFFGINTTSR